MMVVIRREGGLHRIDAPGGYGKTSWANFMLAAVRKSRQVAIATALSGIAATILTLGKTFHRTFGVPIPCFKDSTSNLELDSISAEMIRAAQLIMIDEVSVMS